MQSVRDAAQKEGLDIPISLRSFMQTFGTNSLNTLLVGVAIHQGEIASADLPGGYKLVIEKAVGKYSLRITSNDGSSGSGVDVPTDKLGEEKSDQAVKDIAKKIFEYFQTKAEDIKDGKITAADIGGAIYGIAGAVILVVFAPFAAVGLLFAEVFNFTFTVGAKQVGEYYGSIVDDFIAILKGEDKPTISNVVGTMATLYFTQIIFDVPGGALRFLGTDGWSLTKKVGEEVGNVLEEAINAIDSITGIGDVLGDVGEFFEDIF